MSNELNPEQTIHALVEYSAATGGKDPEGDESPEGLEMYEQRAELDQFVLDNPEEAVAIAERILNSDESKDIKLEVIENLVPSPRSSEGRHKTFELYATLLDDEDADITEAIRKKMQF